MSTQLRVLIVGAGPCGLTAAIAFARRGYAVEVIERSSNADTTGAGIVLAANARRALARFDLDTPLVAAGTPLAEARIEDGRGRRLTTMDMRPTATRQRLSSVAVTRSELARVLCSALDSSAVQYGTTIRSIAQHEPKHRQPATVTVELGNGETRSVDLVVGCDGLHSIVRNHVYPQSRQRYAGYTCWRGIVPLDQPDGEGVFIERWSRGRRFGTVPLADGQTYWFATQNTPAHERDGDDPARELHDRFADFSGSVPAVLQAIAEQARVLEDPSDAVLRRDIYDIAPLPRWTRGSVTLAGDAAHAMTPNLGQGAGQALEDAVALVECVDRWSPDLAAGLRAYEQQRRRRANAVLRVSRMVGGLACLESSASCWLRDRGLTLLDRATRALTRGFSLRARAGNLTASN